MGPKDADRMVDNVDPALEAVLSGSTLFTQPYLTKNLGSLGYSHFRITSNCGNFFILGCPNFYDNGL